MAEHSLIVPFLDESPAYAYGVEFGMLFWQMRYGDDDAIETYFTSENEDQILLLASRLGWRATKLRSETPGWCFLQLERP